MNELRFAFRQLLKNPGFAGITVATLALGVAGNMVIFTIYSSFYLRPFPFIEPDRLVDLDETAPRWNLESTGLSFPEFAGWREHNQSFEAMAAFGTTRHIVSHEGNAEWVGDAEVSHDLMSVLRIQPILGRGFTPEEDRVGGPKVVLLAQGFWKRSFGGREEVVGQTLRLNQENHTIVGVLPSEEILWLVIRQGLVLSAGGIGIGLFGALLATPVTRHLLHGVSPFEPFTIAAVTLGLLLVAVLACWIPARRAMKVDPVEALRSE